MQSESYLKAGCGTKKIGRTSKIVGKPVGNTKRRIEITVEKRRLVILSRRNHSINAWCGACGEQVQMVTPDEAAQLCQVSTRTIYRRIETGRFHFIETENGFSLICLQSLESNGDSASGGKEETITRPFRGFFGTSMKRILKR
jgi:hypothetical protein